MSKLYTYIMTVDYGLAPNPFWGYCTLAVCTPNHKNYSIRHGDWIAGLSTKKSGYKFIYAMKVDERIHMHDYFHDARFQSKKPLLNGNWKNRCGDNFYSQDTDGRWVEHPNPFHEGMRDVDTKVPFVYVAKEFWYLGKNRVSIPKEYLAMVGGRGARVNHPQFLVDRFVLWVQKNCKKGISGDPLNAGVASVCLRRRGTLDRFKRNCFAKRCA